MSKDVETAVKNFSELNAIKIFESKRKLLWYNFMIGMARGLGTVFGATIVVAIILYLLSKIQLIPVVGDFVGQVLIYLEKTT